MERANNPLFKKCSQIDKTQVYVLFGKLLKTMNLYTKEASRSNIAIRVIAVKDFLGVNEYNSTVCGNCSEDVVSEWNIRYVLFKHFTDYQIIVGSEKHKSNDIGKETKTNAKRKLSKFAQQFKNVHLANNVFRTRRELGVRAVCWCVLALFVCMLVCLFDVLVICYCVCLFDRLLVVLSACM
jgi:hypothetical protein